jgi:DNA-binding MarR family transcriptional regulator
VAATIPSRTPTDPGTAAAPAASSWREELGLPEDVGILGRIIRLNMLVSQVLEAIIEPFGIGVGDYLVLSTVRRSPGGRSAPTQLCRVLGRTTGGMTLTLDRLESHGWAQRLPDPADRRRVIVALSSEGRQLASRVNAALHEWEASIEEPGRARCETKDALDRVLELFDPPE